MSAQKHSLQTRDLARFGIYFIYIYDFVLITFLIFSLYWVFVGKVLKMEPVGVLEKNGAKKSSTSRRREKNLTNLIS